MPVPLQSSGKVEVVGMVGVGDVHTIHGNQLQPSFVWIDHMGGTVMDALTDPTNMKSDRVIGVSHSAPVFVPFHQKMVSFNRGALPQDDNVYRVQSNLPIVLWDSVGSGPATLVHTAYGDRFYGFEFFESGLGETATLSDAITTAYSFTTTQWQASSASSAINWDEQGFTVFFQKQKLGYVSSTVDQQVVVQWEVYTKGADKATTIPGRFVLTLRQGKPPTLTFNGNDIRSAMSFGTHPVGMLGSMPVTDLAMQQFVQVMIIGGRMQISIAGIGVPLVVRLERLFHTTVIAQVVNKDMEPVANLFFVPKGFARRLPVSVNLQDDVDVYIWPTGQHPYMGVGGNAVKVTVQERWDAGTNGSVDQTANDKYYKTYDIVQITGNGAGMEIGVLEPRISMVRVSFLGFSQYTFSCHPMRFNSSFSYTSVQQQLGFTPSVTTPPTFDVHMHADIAKNKTSGQQHTCMHIPTARVTITDEHVTGSQISQYSFLATSTETPLTYGNVPTVRYTPGIERISIRYAGITEYQEPNEGNYTLIQIGQGTDLSTNAGANLLVSVTEESAFDFASMRVQQSLQAQWNNYSGIAGMFSATGVRGAGNVALAWRWGYKHSQGINGQEGPSWWSTDQTPVYGPGWGRLYGFCDTYSYAGTTGRYSMTMIGKSMMARLDDTVIHAPPNVDGWNHFRAVYTLLSMAGIPDDRIGFKTADPLTNMVPDDPYGLETADPDYDTGGFFLPVGVGSNPWTPIARSMTIGQLLAMIQQVTQFVMYVDDLGIWRYEPFMRDVTGMPKRVFREYYPYDTNQGLTQMWDVNVTMSTADVRNEVILVGIDAYNPLTFLDPIFVSKRDELSINADAGQQPANYVGWKKNFAMVDSRFATHEFAEKTVERLFNTMRQPTVLVTFSCWGQPDIYPMDFIAVEYARSGISGFPAVIGISPETDNTIPLFVTKIQTTITRTAQGLIPQSRIEARYIPLTGYQDLGEGVSTRGKTMGTITRTQPGNTGGGTGTSPQP